MKENRLKAATFGEKTYKGKKCKKCGTNIKYTTNASCVNCSKERAKRDAYLYRKNIKDLMDKALIHKSKKG